jgi:cysteine-rich repeat protein
MAYLRLVGLGVCVCLLPGCGDTTSSDSHDSGPPGPDADGPCTSQCGNGMRECSEECDDGDTIPGDGCSATCTAEPPPPNCGDGNVDYADGEECDDGGTATGDGCDDRCRIEAPPSCGDGALDIADGELCDDGNTTAGDGCSPTCQLEPVGASCGDGAMDPLEVCDDGNTANGDGCNPTCNLANTTSLFAGGVNSPALVDGIGASARFGGIGTLTVDADYLWVADSLNNVIRRVDIATADVVTVAGDPGGAGGFRDDPIGLNALFGGSEAIATDGVTVWIADQGRIRAMAVAPPHGVTTVAGPGGYVDGIGAAAGFDDLRGLTYYGGYVWLLDAVAGTVRRFDPATAEVVTVAGTPYATGCPPGGAPVDGVGAAAVLCSPRYMASNNSGLLYIGDTNGNTIRSYNTVTGFVGTFAGDGTCGYADGVGAAAQVHRPRGMTSDGTSIYWVEFNAHTIRQGVLASQSASTLVGTPAACTLTCSCSSAPAGNYTEGIGAAALLENPYAVAFHYPSHSLFFIDAGNAVIRRIQ